MSVLHWFVLLLKILRYSEKQCKQHSRTTHGSETGDCADRDFWHAVSRLISDSMYVDFMNDEGLDLERET